MKNVEIIGDSQLVIKQLSREYRCVNEHLMKYLSKAARLFYEFDEVIVRHVPWQDNEEANELAQIGSGYKVSSSTLLKLIKVERKVFPFEEREVNVTGVIDLTDWQKPIIDYLSNPNQQVDRKL